MPIKLFLVFTFWQDSLFLQVKLVLFDPKIGRHKQNI